MLAANYVYDLPNLTKHFGGPKGLNYITDNFELSGVTQFISGTPVDLNCGYSFPFRKPGRFEPVGKHSLYYMADGKGNPSLPAVRFPQRGTRGILRNGESRIGICRAAKSFCAIKSEAIALHPQVVVKRGKALAAFRKKTLEEDRRWLNAVPPLEVGWLAERRTSLAIDKGGFGLRLEPVDYRSWLGEDDSAQLGAYREHLGN